MFNEKKTLIVVYKDEMLVNQLKKLVESENKADGESGMGQKSSSINIVSWTEKVWIGNKKAGNINSKVLFLGDIRGTDKLIPVVDIKFDDSGVKYGWAGNQAVLFSDIKALSNRDDYFAFLEKLSALPVPDIIKNANKPKLKKSSDEVETININNKIGASNHVADDAATKKQGILHKAKTAIVVGADVVGSAFEKAGSDAAVFAEDFFRNKSLVKKQMLFYGVVNLCSEGLESFMCL